MRTSSNMFTNRGALDEAVILAAEELGLFGFVHNPTFIPIPPAKPPINYEI